MILDLLARNPYSRYYKVREPPEPLRKAMIHMNTTYAPENVTLVYSDIDTIASAPYATDPQPTQPLTDAITVGTLVGEKSGDDLPIIGYVIDGEFFSADEYESSLIFEAEDGAVVEAINTLDLSLMGTPIHFTDEGDEEEMDLVGFRLL